MEKLYKIKYNYQTREGTYVSPQAFYIYGNFEKVVDYRPWPDAELHSIKVISDLDRIKLK